jgi:hypothetical protein
MGGDANNPLDDGSERTAVPDGWIGEQRPGEATRRRMRCGRSAVRETYSSSSHLLHPIRCPARRGTAAHTTAPENGETYGWMLEIYLVPSCDEGALTGGHGRKPGTSEDLSFAPTLTGNARTHGTRQQQAQCSRR